MLFSNDAVAAFINNNFEAAWESVRPVPIVKIDFGNGNIITRTLHGNIATYVCSSDGQVLDVLPGIYDPRGYMAAVDQLRILASNLAFQPAEQRAAALRTYHEQRAAALKKGETPAALVEMRAMVAVGKARIERPIEVLFAVRPNGPNPPNGVAVAQPVTQPEDVASWKELQEDARLNEKARRQLIHEKLAGAGAVEPAKVTRWLYKEVLHADLDDPYLGLGHTLFASYPFAKEEKGR